MKLYKSYFNKIMAGLGLCLDKTSSTKSLLVKLSSILAHWQIYNFQIKQISGGSLSSLKLLIKTDHGKYILRNTETDQDYLQFQIIMMNELAQRDFGYNVPQPLKTETNKYFIEYENSLWMLCKFIEGRPLGRISNPRQAGLIGTLVAKYHKIAEIVDLQDYQGFFTSSLFNRQNTYKSLCESGNFIKTIHSPSFVENLFIKNLDLILEAYNNIPDRDVQSVANLPKIPSYQDWHGYNILVKGNKLSALIDFDSLAESPRLADFQCALIGVVSGNKTIDFDRMQTFIKSYFSVLPIDQSQLIFTYSIIIDRLAHFISKLLIEKRVSKNTYKDPNITSAILTMIWLINNQERFNHNLYLFSQL